MIIFTQNTGNSPIHQTQSGVPTDRQRIPLPNKPQDAQTGTFRQARDEEEDPYTLPDQGEDEDPYTLLEPVGAIPQQKTIPTYVNVPRDLPVPIQPEIGYSNTTKVSGTKLHTTGECTFSMKTDCDYTTPT